MAGFWKKCVETYKHPSLTLVRRIIVSLVGGLVLLTGIAMIVLPGPAIFVIPLGLAILASEFLWARVLLNKAKDFVDRRRRRFSSIKTPKPVVEETIGKE